MKVCLCGSLRFYREINEVEQKLVAAGIQAIKPVVFRNDMSSMLSDIRTPEQISGKPRSREEETIGTKMHIANVSLADITYLVSVGGYVGRSTAVEIGVAWALGKKIYATEQLEDPSVEILVTGVLTPEQLIEDIKAQSNKWGSAQD